MSIVESLLKEMDQEANTTRKMLSRIPEDKYDWKPHPKSMDMKRLAVHIAELPAWPALALTTDELDFATAPYEPTPVHNNAELLSILEKSLESGREQIKNADEATLEEPWILRDGDRILSKTSKAEMIRISYSQIVHHRAQLGVYLRLLDIPIPGSYGPSADEPF